MMSPQVLNVQMGNTTIPIRVRENARSKRLSLKYHPIDNFIYLTKPRLASQKDIVSFLERSQNWIRTVLKNNPGNISFEPGQNIPILGEDHVISYTPGDKPTVQLLEAKLHVQGFDPIVVPGLVKDWLRMHLYHFVNDYSRELSQIIGKEISAITIKDTKSRWGSCTGKGNIAYSWRLALAPEAVVRYVCAHEVAHLVEMNHSSRFWDIVAQLCPNYKIHRQWLKTNGSRLFRYN